MQSLRIPCAFIVLAAGACSSGTGRPAYLAGPSYGGGPAPLVGGVTDDNVRLPEYLDYVAAYPHGDVPKLDLTDRQVFTVLDGRGAPCWDVPVRAWTPSGPFLARTNASGSVLLPRAAVGLRPQDHVQLEFSYGNQGQETLLLEPAGSVVRTLQQRRPPEFGVGLDVCLVVDTTSSMDDEVERLRTTLKSVVAGLDAHPLRPRVRVGGVAYRDYGDAYVTQPFDFSGDMGLVQRRLDTLTTGGGGDGPEAVQQALEVAVDRLSWGGEGTLRVLFLVGDAPPHFEHGTPYTVTLRRAVERGITMFPVACSGIDDTGEFVWRQLAAVTLGKFLFVSYGGTTENHTGPYVENDLDTLMRRAVLEQLDALLQAPTHARPGAQARTWPSPVPAPAPYAGGDRIGFGRAPWDFGIPGWTR